LYKVGNGESEVSRMSDMMTFPNTVEEFMEQYKIVDDEKVYTNGADLVPIFRMMQWFEHVSATDTISRQAAIDVLGEEPLVWCDGEDEIAERNQWKRDIEAIKQLPPIQPEIVRCKDCKHWDGVDTCDVIDAPVWDNDFCSMAERRSDE